MGDFETNVDLKKTSFKVNKWSSK